MNIAKIVLKHHVVYGIIAEMNLVSSLVSEIFKFKISNTGNTPNDDNKKEVEIAVPLTYLSDFFWNF